MKKRSLQRVRRSEPIDPEELARRKDIREKVRQEFPPLEPPRLQPSTSGIGARIRAAREAQGLTWYAVAKSAGIPNPSTVRDIECGRDTKLSSLRAIAETLGLSVELIEVQERDEKPRRDAAEEVADQPPAQSLRRLKLG